MSLIDFIKEKKIGFILIISVFLLFFYITRHCNLLDPESIREFIQSHGIISPIIYILVMAITIVISPLPGMPLAAASGVLFGTFWGTLYSLIGAEIGAIISFYLARIFGREFIENILKSHIDFCDTCTERYIMYFIFFSRLLPIFHFDIISYGAGLTNISLKKFAVATFFGMVPMTFLFTNYGQTIFLGGWVSVVISTLIIIAIFLVPILIRKYHLSGTTA